MLLVRNSANTLIATLGAEKSTQVGIQQTLKGNITSLLESFKNIMNGTEDARLLANVKL